MNMRRPVLAILLTMFASAAWSEQLVHLAGATLTAREAAQKQADYEQRQAQNNKSLAIESDQYGTSSDIILSLPASSFQVRDANFAQAFLANGDYFEPTSGSSNIALAATVYVPAGASIKSVTVYYYDNSATQQPSMGLWAIPGNPSGSFFVVDATPTVANPGGYTSATFVVASGGHTVSHANGYVFLAILGRNAGEVNRLVRLDVTYRLQISPAPVTATFADVPVGSTYHRFVEALVAAGITGGCGGGNYCPDAPITRGQMAVFLSGALGLHWAP